MRKEIARGLALFECTLCKEGYSVEDAHIYEDIETGEITYFLDPKTFICENCVEDLNDEKNSNDQD